MEAAKGERTMITYRDVMRPLPKKRRRVMEAQAPHILETVDRAREPTSTLSPLSDPLPGADCGTLFMSHPVEQARSSASPVYRIVPPWEAAGLPRTDRLTQHLRQPEPVTAAAECSSVRASSAVTVPLPPLSCPGAWASAKAPVRSTYRRLPPWRDDP